MAASRAPVLAPFISFPDCVHDSPRFRQQLGQHEANLDELEAKLDKVIKVCSAMNEAGRQYVQQQTQFLAALWELSAYFASDPLDPSRSAPTSTSNAAAAASGSSNDTQARLNQLVHAWQEMVKLQNGVIEQTHRAVVQGGLSRFLRDDVKQMRDTKGYFNKISNDLDSALVKNAGLSRGRPSEAGEDVANLLTATRSCFRYTSLDYVYQVSMLQAKKRPEVLGTLLNLLQGYGAFFREGSRLFSSSSSSSSAGANGGLDVFAKDLAEEIVRMKRSASTLERQMEKRHAHVSPAGQPGSAASLAASPNGVPTLDLPMADVMTGPDIKIEGYLFKRGQNAFRTWNRRWFYLQNNQLCYSKRSGEDVTVMEEDLRICLVRPLMDIDRRFCFEVISPIKSHVLQADSDVLAKKWITTLQQGISSALHETIKEDTKTDVSSEGLQWEDSDNDEENGKGGSGGNGQRGANGTMSATASSSSITTGTKATKKKARRSADQVLLIPGNEYCCDCGSPSPQWASINLGITLCIACSGVHRSLGVHISKVRSLTLDEWEPEILKVMAELGNTIANKIYEAEVHEVVAKRAKPDSSDSEREDWIRSKYVAKAFVRRDVLQKNNTGRWTVRRLRRRARTASLRRNSAAPSAAAAPSKITSSTGTNTADKINAEEILFGNTLGKHHVANIELDSDQESTDGSEHEDDNFSNEMLSKLTPDHLLYRSARAHNLPVMSQALALGADRDWQAVSDGQAASASASAMHQSILSGSVMACEFLLLNGARINISDSEGNTPLHLAAKHGNTGQVCLLLKHRADHHARNRLGQQALDIAVQNSDADIVTLLRLAALNEQIRANDFSGGDDDTFNDVMQEFSQMVYTHPERLYKKSAGSGIDPDTAGTSGEP